MASQFRGGRKRTKAPTKYIGPRQKRDGHDQDRINAAKQKRERRNAKRVTKA